MRSISALIFALSCLAFGESHPTWWTYASPDATALVGIEREALRGSLLEAAVERELTGEGSLGLPELDVLRKSRQLLISAPDFLVIATGRFLSATVRDEASKKGFKRVVYHEVEMWIPASPEEMSLARVSDQLLLVGARQTLQTAIERRETGVRTSPPEEGGKVEIVKRYSPLLPRASRFAQADLWVIAAQLPDPLAGRFVPIEEPAKGFEGGVSIRDGLRLRGTLTAASPAWAAKTATQLKQSLSTWPAMLKGMEITTAGDKVELALSLESAKVSQLSKDEAVKNAASLDAPSAPAVPKPAPVPPEIAVYVNGTATAPTLTAPTLAPATPVALPAPVISPAVAAVKASEPQGRQVIRIFGLDEGVREIEVPGPTQARR